MGEETFVHIAPQRICTSSGQVKAIPLYTLRDLALLRQTIFLKDLAFFDLLYAFISDGGHKAAKPQKKRRITL
jgi:hypothetical protein